MAAGFRSPLPLLGLGAGAAPTTTAGVRSMLAPWIGGAGSAGVAPTTNAGVRSLLAFWVGGAGTAGVTPVPTGDHARGGDDVPPERYEIVYRRAKPEADRVEALSVDAQPVEIDPRADELARAAESAAQALAAQSAGKADPALIAATLRRAVVMPAAAADLEGERSLLLAAMLMFLDED